MGLSFWHWLIVAAISALLLHRQIIRAIRFLADPSRSLKESLGIQSAKGRQALRKQSASQMSVWLIGLGALLLIFAWKTSGYWTSRLWP